MDSLTAPARLYTPQAYRRSGFRTAGEIEIIGLHDTEGGTAESNARFFASKTATGSTTKVCDDSVTYRTLPDNVIPWAAPPCNTNGLHIEMAGFAKWKANDWHHHEAMLHRCAFQVGSWCKQYGIPPVHIGVTGLLKRQKGIVTHADISRAFHQSTHTNPGPGFPLDYFIGLVKAYIAGGGDDMDAAQVHEIVDSYMHDYNAGQVIGLDNGPKPDVDKDIAGARGWNSGQQILGHAGAGGGLTEEQVKALIAEAGHVVP